MDTKNLTKWVLLGLGTGAAAAYFAHPEFGKRRRAAVAGGTKKFLDKALAAGRPKMEEQERTSTEEAELLRTATA